MQKELSQRTAAAGQRLFDLICKALADERGVHLETAVAGAGALAGAALLRDSGVDLSSLKPGDHVIVDRVNETGPMLLDALVGMLRQNGVPPGGDPAAGVPDGHAPLRSIPDLTALLLPQFVRLMTELAIPVEMHPFVAVRTIAQFVIAGQQSCAPAITVAVATDAMVRASKSVPPPATGA